MDGSERGERAREKKNALGRDIDFQVHQVQRHPTQIQQKEDFP